MTAAKLFILDKEIELLWVDMNYYRETSRNGKPDPEVIGGLITVCFPTDNYTDQILRWMTKKNEDNTWNEVDKMENGKVCFYDDGFDYPPTKTYKFDDAHLIYFQEIFYTDGSLPMRTIITISPAIQDYGELYVKRWNENYIPPEEQTPYQPVENLDKKITDFYYTDKDNKKDTKLTYGEKAYLIIESRNMIGEIVDLKLSNKVIDFIYEDKRIKNDTIEGYKIKSNTDKIPVYVISEDNEELD